MTKKNPLIRALGMAVTAGILLFHLPAVAAEASHESSLTLGQAIRLVRDHNPGLKAAEEEVIAADARITRSRSAWFPQITASAGYTWLDTVSEMNFGSSGVVKFMPNDNYDAKITARTTVLDFGRRGRHVDLALTGKKTAEHALEFSRRELSWQTVQLFYGILFLREHIVVEKKQIAALEKALEYAKKRYKTGAATPFDLFSTEARIAATRNQMLDTEHELRRNELLLRRLTGIADNAPLALQGTFTVPANDHQTTPEMVKLAMSQRIELQLAKDNEAAARHRQSLAMKKALPTITGSISYGFNNGYQPDIYELRNTIAANLHFELPLFSGFGIRAEQQESRAVTRAATERRREAEEVAKSDVEETIHALQTASDKIAATELQVKQASLAARHARSRYENGMATALDLLDTEAALSQAELARLQASYSLVLNYYSLKRITGENFW